MLPGAGTFGLCVWGPDGLSCLEQGREGVEALLVAADARVERCKPDRMAALLLDALESGARADHTVLESADHLANFGRAPSAYVVNADEWDRVRPRFLDPRWSAEPTGDSRLECCSVLGWMHQKTTLVRHVYRFVPRPHDPYRVSASYRLEHESEVLSRAIFARTPDLRY